MMHSLMYERDQWMITGSVSFVMSRGFHILKEKFCEILMKLQYLIEIHF